MNYLKHHILLFHMFQKEARVIYDSQSLKCTLPHSVYDLHPNEQHIRKKFLLFQETTVDLDKRCFLANPPYFCIDDGHAYKT